MVGKHFPHVGYAAKAGCNGSSARAPGTALLLAVPYKCCLETEVRFPFLPVWYFSLALNILHLGGKNQQKDTTEMAGESALVSFITQKYIPS